MTSNSFKIDQIILHRLEMRLKNPFGTSFGTMQDKDFFVIEMIDEDGVHGFGESVAFSSPWYTEETIKTNEHIMVDFLIPLLFSAQIAHPDEITQLFAPIRRNHMAKSGLEGAVWDLFARRQNQSLAEALGGKKDRIEVGISIGIQPSVRDLLNVIEKSLTEGYKRIKVKIKPGSDVDVLSKVRKYFPTVPLMADANSAYTIKDIEHLKRLDDLNLMMIEQPLGHDDIFEHAKLQAQLQTPICLDESIHSFQDVKTAIEMGSCQIINVKIGRVGGLTEAKKINDYCKLHHIPLWCGGMLEAGIGRAHNIALTTLDQFVLPGDTSASKRYWEKDIIEPEVIVNDGIIEVPDKPGIGYEVNWKALDSYRVEKKVYSRKI